MDNFFLATNYAVYIYSNWGIEVGKIALPPQSKVTHLLVSEDYLFVSAYSPFVNSPGANAIFVHCTWAFTLDDRTYTQAQYSVDHIKEATFQFVGSN